MHRSIEDLNFFNDRRNCTQHDNEAAGTIDIIDEHGVYVTISGLPTEWTVCDLCNGEGKHVNPAIDCNGLTAEDFHDDPDFAEQYMRGNYDVPCNQCGGRTTIRTTDTSKLSKEERAGLERYRKQEERDWYQHMSELRMGA